MAQTTQKKLYVLASLVFLGVFGWFLWCAVPTLYWGDSAEMASVACSAGVAHSPGYPLFSVLMRPFTWLPVSAAFGLNVMCVFLAAAAAALLLLFLREITDNLVAALSGTLLFVGVPAFAFHSLAIDVYSLHLLLFCALMYCTARHERDGDVRWFLASLLVVSLGMTHHILMYFVFVAYLVYCILRVGHVQRAAAVPLLVFFGFSMYNLLLSHDLAPDLRAGYLAGLSVVAAAYVVYMIFLVAKRRREFRAALAVLGAGIFLFGAATFIFAYLPLASARGPVADWWSPDTPANFLNLLFLKGYPPTFPGTLIELFRRVDLRGLFTEVSIAVLLVALLGAVIMFLRRTHLALLLALAGLMTLAGTLLVQHGKPDALRLPVFLILIIFTAWLMGWLLRRKARGLGLFFIVTGVLTLLAIPLLPLLVPYVAAGLLSWLSPSTLESLAAAGKDTSVFAPSTMKTPLLYILLGLGVFNVAWGAAFWKLNKRALLLAPWYLAIIVLVAFNFARQPLAEMQVMAHSGAAYELGDRMIADTAPGGVLFIGSQAPGIMAYFQSCEAEKIQKKNIAVIPVSFLAFDWKISQLKKEYPKIHFPEPVKGSDEENTFTTRGYGRVNYALTLMEANGAGTRFYSDFGFIPFGLGYATVPHGVVYRIAPGEDLQTVEKLAADDRSPKWKNLDKRDGLGAENVASIHNDRGNMYLNLSRALDHEPFVKRAAAEFDKAIRTNPAYAPAYSNRGQTKIMSGDDEGGIRDMEHAAFKLKPDDPDVYNVLAETMLRRHTQPALERAVQLLQLSISLKQDQPKVFYNLGTAMTMMSRKTSAIAAYTKALELDPGYIEAYRALSRLYISEGVQDCAHSVGYLEDARDYINKSGDVVRMSLQSMDVSMELAIRYHTCGWQRLFYDQMQTVYDQFRKPDGSYDVDFFQAVGTTFREIGRVDITARIFTQAKQFYPDYRLFDMYESLRYADCSESLPLLRNAVRVSPEDLSLRVGYASILGICNLPVETQRQLLAARAIAPREQGVGKLLADLYKATSGIGINKAGAKIKIDLFRNGRPNLDNAVLFYETAMAEAQAAGQEDPEVMHALSVLYRDGDNCDAAVALARHATEVAPKSLSLQTDLIRTLAACKQNDEIPDALKRLFEDFDKNYEFFLEAGTLFRDLGQTDKAVQLYRDFSQVLPDIHLADLFLECGANDCARCVPLLKKALDLAPKDQSLREHLDSTAKTCSTQGKP